MVCRLVACLSVDEWWPLGGFADFSALLGFCLGVVEDSAGDAYFAVAEGDQARVSRGAAFVVGGEHDFAAGGDAGVAEEVRLYLVEGVHVVGFVQGAGGPAEGEDFPEGDGGDVLAAVGGGDFGEEFECAVAAECEQFVFADFAGCLGDAGALCPHGAAAGDGEVAPVGKEAVAGGAGHVDGCLAGVVAHAAECV